MARQRNVGLAACWVLVLTAAPVDAFLHHAPVGGAVGRPASCARVAPASRFQMSTLDDLRNQVKSIETEGLRAELLALCDKTKRGVTSPPESKERQQIIELVEKLETINPEPKPLASDAINGEWRLRWTTSESILGRNRMRGFRVDLDRPILQEIDAKNLKARNVEPITTLRWILGGVRYTNNVEAALTPVSESKVVVQFKKFNLFGGILSFNAPERARGELDTTYLDTGIVCDVDGSRGDSIRISRGDRGNIFVLTKASAGN